MNNLANVYCMQGRYAEAEKLHLKTFEIRERILGDENPDTLSSMDNLATVYSSQGRYAQAEKLYLKTMEIWERVLGQEHPDTLISMNNLADVYSDQGRYSEAEKLHLKTLEIRRRVLGDAHPGTLNSIRNLASLLQRQGKSKEAISLQRELVAHHLVAARAENADVNTINSAAWSFLTIEALELRDPESALLLAIRANDLTNHENPSFLDTLALAYHLTDDTVKAIETQKKAITLLPESESKKRTEFEANLAKYEAALIASGEK